MFDIIFVIVPIFIGCVFVFTFALILSPKLRGKMMSRQIKSMKYMIDDSKETIENITSTMGDISINSKKSILDKNEENLKDIVNKTANISKDGIETTVRAIKKGLSNNTIYCKHCGSLIDADSKFCKHCGKKL